MVWHSSLFEFHPPDGPEQDIVCTMLPMGWLLLIMDSYFDLQWVLFPSDKSASALKNYYSGLLRPTYYWPGYFFPLYAIYKLCVQCSDNIYNWTLLLLFLPLVYRYRGIMRNEDSLRHWWTVLVIRVLLFAVTTINFMECGCRWDQHLDHITAFWGFTKTPTH